MRKNAMWQDLVEDLQTDIFLGRRHPRERLIEDEVMESAGATRHAVRRAFDELERLGLAERQVNRGVRVRDYSREQVENLYEIRGCLERQAALRFTSPASSELIAELTFLATQHAEASEKGDYEDIFRLNNAFHQRIYTAAGNPLLRDAIEHYTIATQPIRTRAFPIQALRTVAVEEHFEMVEFVAKGDGIGLAECISLHIRGPMKVFMEHFF